MTDGPNSPQSQGSSGQWSQGNPPDVRFPGQDGTAGPAGGEPGYPPPPGYGQPGYGSPQPGYGYAPRGYGYAPDGQPPPTYMAWARIATFGGVLFSLIFGFPAGLVAISYASRARRYWAAGNQAAAASASRKARTWSIVSTALDVLGIIVLIAIIGTSGSSSGLGNSSAIAALVQGAQSFLTH